MVYSFPEDERLKTKHEFEEVFKYGKKVNTKLFRAYVLISKSRKLGIIISKKVSKSAVRRNKIKRQIRELYRTNKFRIPDNIRIILIALSQAEKSSFDEISEDILQIFDRISNFPD